MPTDIEIHLGAVGAESCEALAAALGVRLVDANTGKAIPAGKLRAALADGIVVDADVDSVLQAKLDLALCAVYHAKGWRIIGARTPERFFAAADAFGWTRPTVSAGQDLIASTPWGIRQASDFALYLVHDSEEVGDTPDTATLGVHLSGRYTPVVLDMKDDGMLPAAFPIGLHADDIALCAQALGRLLPGFGQAVPLLRTVFY